MFRNQKSRMDAHAFLQTKDFIVARDIRKMAAILMVNNRFVTSSMSLNIGIIRTDQGGKGRDLNNAIKALFFTTMDLNILLHMLYVPSQENPADAPSRRLSSLDYTLTSEIWNEVQLRFGGGQGHTCDLMALDSNAMLDRLGRPLPHFTPFPSPGSIGVNLLAQDLTQFSTVMQRPYVFPPNVLVGPVLRFLQSYRQPCTVVVLDTYPRKYWWPLLQRFSRKAQKLAGAGDSQALLSPSKKGWGGESGIPADLWAFQIDFPFEF